MKKYLEYCPPPKACPPRCHDPQKGRTGQGFILFANEKLIDRGRITIEKDFYNSPRKDDLVFQNDLPAPDGTYRIGFLKYITVEKGRIIKA